ncbi:MAG: LuxR C-terminal-related transcriptional regulator [Anaerolineales bacterium]
MRKVEPGALDLYETLTLREREVFQLAAEGSKNKEIATRLSISPRTAETHRANLMRKLDLQTQTDLIRYALLRGILPMEG